METKKKALGKGLEELFSNSSFTIDTLEDTIVKEERNNATEIDLSQIRSNPYQPRKVFDEEALNELADSIKVYGVVEPVILKKSVKGYEIVAGERRCKASKIAGLTTVPAIIKDFTDEEMMEIALLENIQREDLNPVDTAISISNILQVKDMTQEEFSKKFGKSRSYITNVIGLLRLPSEVQELVSKGKISMGHARALSKLESDEEIIRLAHKIDEENITVRDVEDISSKEEKKVKITKKVDNNDYKYVEDLLRDKLDTKIKIKDKKIEISFTNVADLNRILEILNVKIVDEK